ncbi:FkbM family methyltransferase [Pelagibacteraceae bacterium]|nr:FkbM family methyltransferase [Pelagibacteraceae bacterium]
MFDKIRNKIHILQNIFLKNKYFIKKKSYAMDGEDLAIDQYIEKKEKGFYVDIGAHHPIHRNNTQLLFNSGWSGINIDVNQFSIDLFNFLRPNDLNLLAAISDNEGEINFYYQKKFSQLNTTDKNIAHKHFNGNFKERLVKCQTIHNILTNSKYKEVKIDLLNIDVEGAEIKVLKNLNFEIYDPSIICIEILGYRDLDRKERENKIKDDEIFKYLISKNYTKVWSGSSYCSHLFIKS